MPVRGEHTAYSQDANGDTYDPFLGPPRPAYGLQQATREQTRGEQDESLTEEEASTQTIREGDDPTGRYEHPETPRARQYCMRQYEVLQQRRANHTCDQEPCFDAACPRDLPGGNGCRYGEVFHSELTSPCMWGWGKILVEHAERYGCAAAMTGNLNKMAQLYRERHVHDQRFAGPVVVRDPPNAPDDTHYYLVVEPPEQNEQRRRGTT